METFIAYLIESALILGILTLFYKSFLHNETLFKFNRFYLLMSVALATVVPFLSFSLGTKSAGVEADNFSNLLGTVNVYANNVRELIVPVVAKSNMFKLLYVLGAVALLCRLLWGFIRLGGLSKKASWTKENGVRVANLPGRFNPFSFFQIIFVNQTLYSSSDLEKIMIHEKAHVRLKHSVDVILFELLLIVQWFNPFVWFTKFLLKELHEFQADKTVLKSGMHVGEYKLLLLNQVTGVRLFPVNNLNQSITKKRFKMMTNKTLKNILLIKSIVAVAVLITISTFFACTNSDEGPELAEEPQSYLNVDLDEEVYFLADVMPQFPGGDLGLREYIASNVRYPKEAQEQGKEGRAYVQFVVDKTGTIKDVKIARSSECASIDEEAIRVVSAQPQWQPGIKDGKSVNVSYTVPINFVLRK
ncbi:M56 family metallopeptidase [Saccharicrinis aurantiacus]|uniref:M56 family metallopeptidase n=1 Tax=Saccharicrinis aurantiacus TaxID=1849719 RepID=UPI0008388DAE|nr:M56 family metallopeptidase [Saccharicrinis aurantiacus]